MNIPGKDAFKQVEGDNFLVNFEDGTQMVLRLDKVEEQAHLDNADVEHFSLNFSAPDDRQLIQAAFHMEHDTLGKLFIFLVPVDQRDGRFHYQAVFSVRKEAVGS